MDLKMFVSVLGAAVLGFIGIFLLLPEEVDDGVVRLPWQVSVDGQGRTQVFGFTLGETRLAEVRSVFGEEGKLSLFAQPGDGTFAVEAYFDQIYLNRLRADFVMTLAADQATLAPMFERGLRISQLGSGAKRVTLDPDDARRLADSPIRSITYLPWKSLDADIVERRFGPPVERASEEGTEVIHWLYPERGLDIGLDPRGGVVIQYVNPGDFAALVAPLHRDSIAPAGEPDN